MPSQLVCTQYHRLPGQSVHGRRLRHAERNRLCVAQRVNYKAGHLKEHLGLQACERVSHIRVHAGIGIVEIGLVLVLGLKLHGDAIATCTTLFFFNRKTIFRINRMVVVLDEATLAIHSFANTARSILPIRGGTYFWLYYSIDFTDCKNIP